MSRFAWEHMTPADRARTAADERRVVDREYGRSVGLPLQAGEVYELPRRGPKTPFHPGGALHLPASLLAVVAFIAVVCMWAQILGGLR